MPKPFDSDEVIGLIVHSYNNYLSGTLGFVELAALETRQPEVAEKIDLSLESGRAAVDFGKQLLAAVGRLQVTLHSIRLAPVIAEVCDLHDCRFEVSKSNQLLKVKSDKTWLKRILVMLVEFSRATSPESKLGFTLIPASNDNNTLQIHFSPSHLKLSQEQELRLFEPFYTSRNLLGTKDVGLAVVAGFVQQMGGRIDWSETRGFVIELPNES